MDDILEKPFGEYKHMHKIILQEQLLNVFSRSGNKKYRISL